MFQTHITLFAITHYHHINIRVRASEASEKIFFECDYYIIILPIHNSPINFDFLTSSPCNIFSSPCMLFLHFYIGVLMPDVDLGWWNQSVVGTEMISTCQISRGYNLDCLNRRVDLEHNGVVGVASSNLQWSISNSHPGVNIVRYDERRGLRRRDRKTWKTRLGLTTEWRGF